MVHADAERGADPAWSAGPIFFRHPRSAQTHQIEPRRDFYRSNEHGLWNLLRSGDDVKKPVHSIAEIDVRDAARRKHDFRPGRASITKSVARRILWASVSLGLGDHPFRIAIRCLDAEKFAQKKARHPRRSRVGVVVAGEFSALFGHGPIKTCFDPACKSC